MTSSEALTSLIAIPLIGHFDLDAQRNVRNIVGLLVAGALGLAVLVRVLALQDPRGRRPALRLLCRCLDLLQELVLVLGLALF